jgi:hypothetical protein
MKEYEGVEGYLHSCLTSAPKEKNGQPYGPDAEGTADN